MENLISLLTAAPAGVALPEGFAAWAAVIVVSVAAATVLAAAVAGRGSRAGRLGLHVAGVAVISACAAVAFYLANPPARRLPAGPVEPPPARAGWPCLVEPIERHLVTAPFDGVLKAVAVKPGDRVVADKTVLARLDTAAIELELAAREAELAGYVKARDVAMAGRETVEAQIAGTRVDQAKSRIALIRHRIAQASVRSRIDGVVLQGEPKSGRRVKMADVLFDVGSPGRLGLRVAVPEADIGEVRAGQKGQMTPAGQPGRLFAFEVRAIDFVPMVYRTQGVFHLQCRFIETPQLREAIEQGRLKPGTQGTATVETDSPASSPARSQTPSQTDPFGQAVAIHTPFDGRLESVARPGDRVEADQVVAVMSSAELGAELDLLKASGAELTARRDAALRDGHVAAVQACSKQLQALAERTRELTAGLAGGKIRSPISGVVLGPDMAGRTGSTLTARQPLLVVAPVGPPGSKHPRTGP